jgi:uncharacterized GH25 family protein
MNMKKSLLVFLLVTESLSINAQELWMQPDKSLCKTGDSLTIEFNAGRNFNSNPWNLTKSKISRLQFYDMKGPHTISAAEGKVKHIKMRVQEDGTKLFVMQGIPASIEIGAEEFNEYLKKYGLDDALNFRKNNNALDKPGKELYERSAKLLVQVGGRRDETWKKAAGLPLEIVPLSNPYTVKIGDVIRFRILYEGKPLFGARIFVWNKTDGRTFMQPVYSQQDGTIEARISDKGPWMISVVKMIPSKEPEADWKSYWSSLVFGVN